MAARAGVAAAQAAAVSRIPLGRFADPDEVARELFHGKVSRKWVLANVPSTYRHRVGRLVLYYEGELRLYIDSLREVA